ncbi:hypothetical protein HBZS_106090 [Helicobacter bizzozeronii CCUG 35545]|nr:hypothetical protein HBZS_106090 [Helicobacter bizzozeronii CCUG 35545]
MYVAGLAICHALGANGRTPTHRHSTDKNLLGWHTGDQNHPLNLDQKGILAQSG